MEHEPSNSGYRLHRVRWTIRKSLESSWSLAQAVYFTDLETSGLRYFVECIWERVLGYQAMARSRGLPVDAATHCITPVGYEPETRQVSLSKRLEAACRRWRYKFEGNRYYHDCKEWSGKAKLQEYTVPEDVCYPKLGLARNCSQETIGLQSSVSFFSESTHRAILDRNLHLASIKAKA